MDTAEASSLADRLYRHVATCDRCGGERALDAPGPKGDMLLCARGAALLNVLDGLTTTTTEYAPNAGYRTPTGMQGRHKP